MKRILTGVLCAMTLLAVSGVTANRWGYRAALTASFGPLVALGFDDYFYGV